MPSAHSDRSTRVPGDFALSAFRSGGAVMAGTPGPYPTGASNRSVIAGLLPLRSWAMLAPVASDAENSSPTAALAVGRISEASRPVAAAILHAVAQRDRRRTELQASLRDIVGAATTAFEARAGASTASLASVTSLGAILSYRSLWSVASAGSALSVLSLGSLGSVGSILSVGSAGSILSIGSTGSILSIGSAGSYLTIGETSDEQRARGIEARDAALTRTATLLAWCAIAAAAWRSPKTST
jgi:hypothetical protein